MQAPPCFHIFDFAVVSLSLGYLSLFPLYTLPSSIELKAMSDFVLCWMLLVTWRLYSRTHPPMASKTLPNPYWPVISDLYTTKIHFPWIIINLVIVGWFDIPMNTCACGGGTLRPFPEHPQTSPNLKLVDVIWNFIGRVKRVTFQIRVK